MIEFLSPSIFFVWLFSLVILLILGGLFWMMRDSHMAEPATLLLLCLVACAILLGTEITEYKAEKAETEVNVTTPVEDVQPKVEDINAEAMQILSEISQTCDEIIKMIEDAGEEADDTNFNQRQEVWKLVNDHKIYDLRASSNFLHLHKDLAETRKIMERNQQLIKEIQELMSD